MQDQSDGCILPWMYPLYRLNPYHSLHIFILQQDAGLTRVILAISLAFSTLDKSPGIYWLVYISSSCRISRCR